MAVGTIIGFISGNLGAANGSGYLVGDTGFFKQGANVSASFIVTTVDGTGQILGTTLVDGGAGYFCQYPMTTQPGGAQPYSGSGAGWGVSASVAGVGPGAIASYFGIDQNSGAGYSVLDTGILVGGGNDATYIVTGFDPDTGKVGLYISFGGTGYSASTNYNTITGGAQPGSGSGLIIGVIDVIPVSVGPTSGNINRTFHAN